MNRQQFCYLALLLVLVLLLVLESRSSTRRSRSTSTSSRSAAGSLSKGVPVSVRLTDVAAAAGVRFQHEYGSQHPLPIVETMGSGCAFLDYDNDGRPDLFLVSSGLDFRAARQRPGCKLFHNEGAGRFTDATQAAGIAIDAYAMGCCIGDYDNDGYGDLFVSGYGHTILLHNAGGSG